MKRDLDRIRELLIVCEGDDKCRFSLEDLRFTDFDRYQIELMSDAGFIELHTPKYRPGAVGSEMGLATYGKHYFTVTWQGHDYLDAIRDDSIWKKTKKAVIETGGNATLEITKALALGFLKQKIEKHTGITL